MAAFSEFHARLGSSLQKHRLRSGLTQSQVAELADLSLKYYGEIERGEANTTLGALERISAVIKWDPMEAFNIGREPLSENVRVMLITELDRMIGQMKSMVQWLRALDPMIHPTAQQQSLPPAANETSNPKERPRASRRQSARRRNS